MDLIVILALGLIFCFTSQKGEDTLEMVIEEQQAEVANLEIKTNDTFTQEEHAFEVIAHGLNFC